MTYPAYEETDAAVRAVDLAREQRDKRNGEIQGRPPTATEPSDAFTPQHGDAPEPEPRPEIAETPESVSNTPANPQPEPVTTTPDAKPGNADNSNLTQRSKGAMSLYDDRARIWSSMQEFLNETRDRPLSGTEEETWGRMEQDMDRVNRSIEVQERGEKLRSILEAPADQPVSTRSAETRHPATPDVRSGSAAAQALSGHGDSAVPGDIQRRYNYERAFNHYLRRGMENLHGEERSLMEAEYRDLGVGVGASGGFTVPAGFLNRITDAMKAFGGMLDIVNVIDTDSGQPLVWPTADDTGNIGAIVTENNLVPTQDVAFGQKTLGAYMYTSKMVKVSIQLLNDSAFALEPWLGTKFGQRLGRVLNSHFTAGTGGGTQPTGILAATGGLTAVQLGVGNTTAAALTGDVLIDLVHSIDPAYRGRGRFVMSDATLKVLRKLKESGSTNQYLWQPGLQAGAPDTILGYPITINQDMPSSAASAKVIGFGDFNAAYIARRVAGITTLRLNERYADNLQVGFLAFSRWDGAVDDTNAAKVLQHSAT